MSKPKPEPEAEAPVDGKTQFEQVGADPTLDLVMKKDPRDVTDEDLEALVEWQRQERAFKVR